MSGGRMRECWRGETRQVRTCGKQRTGKILGKAEEFWGYPVYSGSWKCAPRGNWGSSVLGKGLVS